MSDLLRAVDVHKDYHTLAQPVRVLKGLSLSVRAGEFVAVVGRSGSGKSTLLHVLGLVDRPTAGEVFMRDEYLNRLRPRQQDRVRNRAFGFVFQFYHLMSEFTALGNVLMPMMIGRNLLQWQRDRRRLRREALALLERLGLADRADHKPAELSGGEQQRVAIGRALIHKPEVVLCDEPTGNLDQATASSIIDLLVELNRDSGQAIVLVTHDMDVAARAQRIVHLTAGRIEEVGRVEETA